MKSGISGQYGISPFHFRSNGSKRPRGSASSAPLSKTPIFYSSYFHPSFRPSWSSRTVLHLFWHGQRCPSCWGVICDPSQRIMTLGQRTVMALPSPKGSSQKVVSVFFGLVQSLLVSCFSVSCLGLYCLVLRAHEHAFKQSQLFKGILMRMQTKAT